MRHSWRDTLAAAGDLALLGFLVTLAALPVVTAGAAVLTGSHAVSVFVREDRWPPLGECRAVFRRAFRPGLAGTVVVAAAGGVLVADFAAVRSGAVPGGVPMMVLIVLVALAGGGLVAVAVARRERLAATRPRTVAAAAGMTGVVVLLAVLVHPVLIPVLVGYWLFALHVVTRASRAPLDADAPSHLDRMTPRAYPGRGAGRMSG